MSLEDDPWGDDAAVGKLMAEHNVCRETLIPSNWSSSLARWRKGCDHSWIERIVAHGGRMLIVACGPGGSHAPHILDLDPQAQLLLNDIGRWVMVEWKRFADEKEMWPHLSCAQFNAERFPVRSGYLDGIDSSGALGEIAQPDLTLQEAFRTLRPGGKLFLGESAGFDPECLSQFPEEGLQELRDHGFIGEGPGLRERLASLGFEITFHHEGEPRTLNLGRSTLADIAAKYGVQMRGSGVTIEAQKPPR